MKKFKQIINELNLNLQREIGKLIVINILFIFGVLISILFLKSYLFGIIFVLLLLASNFIFFKRYDFLKTKNNLASKLEVINLLNLFKVSLNNSENIYKSLENLKEYASFKTKEQLITLFDNIKNDRTIEPFLNISHRYNDQMIDEAFISIYWFLEEGINEASLIRFNQLMDRLSDSTYKKYTKINNRKIDFINALSLVGIGILFVILIYSIIFLIGDINNAF